MMVITMSLFDLNLEELKRVSLYLAPDEVKEDDIKVTSYSGPFNFINLEYKVIGVRTQIQRVLAEDTAEEFKLRSLISIAQRNIRWRNGKDAKKQVKEAIEIFNYLDMEEAFEAELV